MDGYALVIGESLIDVVGGVRHPGGSPMNVAVGLGRLGRRVELATWFGRDETGDLLREHLATSHVAIVPGSDGAARTSSAQVVFDAAGSASYVFDLEWRLPQALSVDAAPQPLGVPLVVHTGSIAAALQPGAGDVLETLRRLRGTTVISFDPNIRPQIIGAVESARPLTEQFVGLANVVKASDEDVAWLYPGVAPIDSVRRWARSGPALVVLTKGASGVTAMTRRDEIDVPAPDVAVVDTVGAGDAFMAGLLHALWSAGLLGAGRASALAGIDAAALRQALATATEVAAVTLSHPGADSPWVGDAGG